MYCSHVAYCTTLNVQTLTTSRLTKRSWQSEVELNLMILDVPTFTTSRLPRDPSSQRWNYVGEKWPMNFAWNARLPRSIQGSFTCRKSTTWDRRLYFPFEGRRAEDFFGLKNPTASAGFEPANLGSRSWFWFNKQTLNNISDLHFKYRDHTSWESCSSEDGHLIAETYFKVSCE